MMNRFLSMALIVLLLLSSANAVSYLHGNGQLAAKLDGELEFYHSDSLGSTRAITDEAAEVIERQTNLPFGEILTGDEKYGFTGKELDESGLQYFGARYYDSGTGRFVSADPAMSGINWYAYSSNNPLRYVDPTGYTQESPWWHMPYYHSDVWWQESMNSAYNLAATVNNAAWTVADFTDVGDVAAGISYRIRGEEIPPMLMFAMMTPGLGHGAFRSAEGAVRYFDTKLLRELSETIKIPANLKRVVEMNLLDDLSETVKIRGGGFRGWLGFKTKYRVRSLVNPVVEPGPGIREVKITRRLLVSRRREKAIGYSHTYINPETEEILIEDVSLLFGSRRSRTGRVLMGEGMRMERNFYSTRIPGWTVSAAESMDGGQSLMTPSLFNRFYGPLDDASVMMGGHVPGQ